MYGNGRPMIEKPEDILTTGEAAVLCGVSRSTLRRAVGQGQIVAWHTPGRHLRFTRGACLDFAVNYQDIARTKGVPRHSH